MSEEKKPKGFADLAGKPENERIKIIAHYLRKNPSEVVGIAIENQRAKIDRYRSKLSALGFAILDEKPMAGTGMIVLRVATQ
jgi:hypothetical protein